jgi:hypothetical protein
MHYTKFEKNWRSDYKEDVKWSIVNARLTTNNKRPMGHIAHLSSLGQYRNSIYPIRP